MSYETDDAERALVVRVGDDPGPADLRLPDGPLAELGPAAYAELRLLAMPPESTFDGADLDGEPVAEPWVSSCETPAPPAPNFVHPYFQSNAFTGRATDLAELDAWLAHGQPARVITARGGIGKSALAWAWVERRLADAPPWAGCLWFSFYERGAHFEALIRRLAAYAAGVPPSEALHGPREVLERQVLAALRARPFLIVIDGLERALVAYHRLNAMRLADEVADEAVDLHSCTDPRDGELLRALCQASPSRLLATSRIFPTDLRDGEGLAPGVELRTLDGLDPAELPALLRALGLDPDAEWVGSATQAMATLGHHALLWRLLAGCAQENPWLLVNILSREPAKLRKNILEAAFEILPARVERLLSRLALLHYAAELDDVLGLITPPLGLRRPSPPPRARLLAVERSLAAGPHPDSLRELQDRRDSLRARCDEWDIYRGLVDSYERLPGTRAHYAAIHADLCLLETRGFLAWDRSSNRYDLHPIVRAHALGRVDHDERALACEEIRDHFRRAPRDVDEGVRCTADLRRSLELHRAYVGTGDLDTSSELYEKRLRGPLDDLSAYPVVIELLTPLFPDGLLEPPDLEDPTAQSRRISDLSRALMQVGRSVDAMAMRELAVRLNYERRRPYSLVRSLCDRGQSLAAANRTHAAMHAFTVAHRLMVAHGRKQTLQLHHRAVLATEPRPLGRGKGRHGDPRRGTRHRHPRPLPGRHRVRPR
ncbi:hypothetical protein [Nannocystis pusilla]|uniref:hypothetical protein n=1 Tax=Nannocystis pusilla TaxID=889268 RepID=UPI003DA5801C